jgi:hypothetical protein
MNRTFDFYEYAAFIIPGAILAVGLLWLFPEGRVLFSKEGLTLGELGIFVIVAYAAGQLVQAIGNYIEWAWWKLSGGMPSRQVLVAGVYVTPQQHKRILEAVRARFQVPEDLSTLSGPQARSVLREVYAVVAASGKSSLVDTFEGRYGMLRGLAAAILVITVAAIVASKGLYVIGGLILLFLLAIYRMQRFDKAYATELFVQFLATTASQAH